MTLSIAYQPVVSAPPMMFFCPTFHLKSVKDICKDYQARYALFSPHPCGTCEKADCFKPPKPITLRQRNGGRHKAQPEEVKLAKKREYALKYYHDHKPAEVQPRKAHYVATEKTCKTCGFPSEDPYHDFYKAATLDGLNSECRKCQNARRARNNRERRGQ